MIHRAATLVLMGASAALAVYSEALSLPAPLLAFCGCALAGVFFAVLENQNFKRLMQWLAGAEATPAPSMTGDLGEIAYLIDKKIQRLRQENQTAAQQLNLLLAALQAPPDGLIILDAHNTISWCNETACAHFALKMPQDAQQNICNLVRTPDFMRQLELAEKDASLIMAQRGGKARLAVQLYPFSEGRRLILSRDITQVERAEQMRRDFVANVSHEIRTPLTVLNGFVETLLTLPLNQTERETYLKLMQEQGERLENLVRDLLTLAELDNDAAQPQTAFTLLDGTALLKPIQNNIEALSNGQHTFTWDIAPVQIRGNSHQLQSAMQNLLSNAVRYTPAGGAITARLYQNNEAIIFSVNDSGVGIPPEAIPRLTERFYRVDKGRSRSTGGTGLGLAIVKHIAQRHGGWLLIESELGAGSSFSLVLPLR